MTGILHPRSPLGSLLSPPMASAAASAPRLRPNRFMAANGLMLGITNPLRSHVLGKAPAWSRWKHPVTHCLLNTTPVSIEASTATYDPTRYIHSLAESIPENLHHAAVGYAQGLVLADLDPATAKLAISITGPLLSAFGFLFILRIVMSWYPKLPVGEFPYVIAYAPTEPFLGITRKVIPPLGGVDVTPVVWFGLISFLNEILVGPQGLLVLLSQQVQAV